MDFRGFLLEVENRGGTKMMKPDGKRVRSLYSGRKGESQATPESPQTKAINPMEIPPSTMSPGTKTPQGVVPGGAFGGSGADGQKWPREPSAFGRPAPPPDFRPSPSEFVNTLKWSPPTNLK